MSDRSISIVPRLSEYPDKEQKSKEILTWLIAKDTVKPVLSDCTLGSQYGNLDRKAVNISQNVGLPFTVFKGFHVNFNARYLYSQQLGLKDINYVFMDAFVRYRPKKWKTDLDFSLTNIGNIKRFDVYIISANMESQNSYTLRGRMAVLKTTINF